MSTLVALATCAVTAWTLTPDGGVETALTRSPVAYVLLDDPDELPPDDICECKPSSGSATNSDMVIECPGGVDGSLFVTTPSKTPGPCDIDESGCKAKEDSTCKVTVKAVLMWPVGCCASAALIGPTIGTSADPCSVATASGGNVEQTWTLSAKCNMVSNTGNATDWFKVWCDTACPGTGHPPSTTPTAQFAPTITCAACKKKT